ncbi:MAG TPA: LytR family transcriptional regulator, partial [Oceanithermus sp.]|nr:LytR family transcriptional regulator [Oceanithermus sp.]
GGVDVYLPAPMDYDDNAANLHIHFPKGRVHLNGEDAVKYMRFRGWVGSDLSRLDRIKEVLLKAARKAASPEYWPRLPGLLGTIWDRLETDLPLEQALVFLPYLKGLRLHAATLPVVEEGPYLVVRPEERARFLRAFFGVGAGEAVPLPRTRALLYDGTGAGLGEAFAEGFARLGLSRPEVRVVRPQATSEVRVDEAVLAGRFYAEAAGLPLVTRFRLFADADVVIVLGRDLLE